MSKHMTDQEYVDSDGMTCPACGSGDVSGMGAVEIDGAQGLQSVECEECGADWVDVLRLTGYTSLNLNNEATND